MSDNKQPEMCTLDHAGKQRDAIDRSDERFWVELARRRRDAALRKRRAESTARRD